MPVSVQTINHDDTALTHIFKLVLDNPASPIEKPDPKSERHRIVSAEEWAALQRTTAPHLMRFLAIAYSVGPRKGELLKLE